MLSISEALNYLTKERLQNICREQDLNVSGNKPEIIARLTGACARDLATILDGLQVDDLLEIAWNHFDEGVIREFVLTTAIRRRVRDGAPRPNEPTKLYSTGRIGNTSPLNMAAIKADASHTARTTVVSAYYVPSILEDLLVECGDVRFVTNGLGGRRLEEQLAELCELEDRLDNQNHSATVRLAFSPGIFHTKLYLFESESDTVAWVGSANATRAALNGHNEEVLVRLDPAPPSVLEYASAVWDTSSDLDDCRPDVDSLAAFFRTGNLYYQPYANLRVTVNPFKPLLDRLPPAETAKLSPFTSPYAVAEGGIGAFNVRLVYQDTGGSTVDVVSKKQAKIRPYAVETCYGYWVPEPFLDKVDEIIESAAAANAQFLERFLGWLEGEGYKQVLSEFRGYLGDAKQIVIDYKVDWESNAQQYGYVFESSDSIEKCVEDLVGQLRHPIDRVKHSHAFVTARLPEIWDDVVARAQFERTFFESLEVQSSKRRNKRSSAKWIFHHINYWDGMTADDIQKELEERLADPAWYDSIKDGSLP